MKKTLFAVAALALCGTAVAGEYYASDYEGKDFDDTVYGEGGDVVFNVDKTVVLDYFDAYYASSVTLNFIGENTFSTPYASNFRVAEGSGTLAITGDNDAKIHWGESLTSSAGGVKTLTLVSSSWLWAPASASFEGLTESGSITLGDAALTYMGFRVVETAAEAEALITGDKQIALVAIKNAGGCLALVGKGAATTPEPATATLSLLALAGLASRRRRH